MFIRIFKYTALVVATLIILLAFNVTKGKTSNDITAELLAPDGCWLFTTTAYTPYKSGSKVYGNGYGWCANDQDQWKIVVQVEAREKVGGIYYGRGATVAKNTYCLHSNDCLGGSLDFNYNANYEYRTLVSAYPNPYQNQYAVSAWVKP
jgi:hypothetical protein